MAKAITPIMVGGMYEAHIAFPAAPLKYLKRKICIKSSAGCKTRLTR